MQILCLFSARGHCKSPAYLGAFDDDFSNAIPGSIAAKTAMRERPQSIVYSVLELITPILLRKRSIYDLIGKEIQSAPVTCIDQVATISVGLPRAKEG
jgi:hypothetical protein